MVWRLKMPWNRKDCSEYVHSTQWNIRQSVQLWLTMAQVHMGGYRSRLSPRWGVAIRLITSLASRRVCPTSDGLGLHSTEGKRGRLLYPWESFLAWPEKCCCIRGEAFCLGHGSGRRSFIAWQLKPTGGTQASYDTW